MKYKDFDKLVGRGSANKIILLLQKEAYMIDELAKELNLNRTSVFYHLKNLVDEGIIEKKMLGKSAVYGLIPEKRPSKKMEKYRLKKCDSKSKGKIVTLDYFRKNKNYGSNIVQNFEGLKVGGFSYVRPYNEDDDYIVTRIK